MRSKQVFISYSREDFNSVRLLVEKLTKDVGDVFWMDLEGIESGEKFDQVIIQAINNAQITLFMYTDNVIKSEWVKKEASYTVRTNKKLIPVFIKGKKMKDWADFHYGEYDSINIQDPIQYQKLVKDLINRLGIKKEAKDASAISYKEDISVENILKSALPSPTHRMLDYLDDETKETLDKLAKQHRNSSIYDVLDECCIENKLSERIKQLSKADDTNEDDSLKTFLNYKYHDKTIRMIRLGNTSMYLGSVSGKSKKIIKELSRITVEHSHQLSPNEILESHKLSFAAGVHSPFPILNVFGLGFLDKRFFLFGQSIDKCVKHLRNEYHLNFKRLPKEYAPGEHLDRDIIMLDWNDRFIEQLDS